MSNSFWVYVNEPNDKAFVHLAECSHCNSGKGRMQDKLDHNGRWEGPFDEGRAKIVARNSGKKTIRWCSVCSRRLGLNGTAL